MTDICHAFDIFSLSFVCGVSTFLAVSNYSILPWFVRIFCRFSWFSSSRNFYYIHMTYLSLPDLKYLTFFAVFLFAVEFMWFFTVFFSTFPVHFCQNIEAIEVHFPQIFEFRPHIKYLLVFSIQLAPLSLLPN